MNRKFISDPETLLHIVNQLKSQGKSIVMTNGCFDVLHVGHIRCLKGAKERGDVLIVAVNDDASMRRLKIAGRPIMPESERIEILEALECVDFITLFSEERVDRLLTPRGQTTRKKQCLKGKRFSHTGDASPSSGMPRLTQPPISFALLPALKRRTVRNEILGN
jgi:rfaE bifunctional protein nucleotidyltransferase chain/domain